jgi:hypothetical protein
VGGRDKEKKRKEKKRKEKAAHTGECTRCHPSLPDVANPIRLSVAPRGIIVGSTVATADEACIGITVVIVVNSEIAVGETKDGCPVSVGVGAGAGDNWDPEDCVGTKDEDAQDDDKKGRPGAYPDAPADTLAQEVGHDDGHDDGQEDKVVGLNGFPVGLGIVVSEFPNPPAPGPFAAHGLGPFGIPGGGDQCQPYCHFPVPLKMCRDTGIRA